MFAAVCVVLAASGHALASGAAVPGWTVLAASSGSSASRWPSPGAYVAAVASPPRWPPDSSSLHALFGLGRHGGAGAAAGGRRADPVRRRTGLRCGSGRLSPAEAQRIVTTAGIDPATVTGGHLAPRPERPGARPTRFARQPAAEPAHAARASAGRARHRLAAPPRRDRALPAGRTVRVRRPPSSWPGPGCVRCAPRWPRTRTPCGSARAPAPGPAHARTAAPLPCPRREALQHTVIRRGPPPAYVRAA